MAETFRGGGAVGPSEYMGYHASWPLVSLTVDFDALTFKIFPLTYRIEKSRIQFLLVAKRWGFSRLRIIHTQEGFPKSIVFFPISFPTLEQALSMHGYATQPADSVPAAEIQNLHVQYSTTITKLIWAPVLAGFLAAFVGMTAAYRATKAQAPLRAEALRYVEQALAANTLRETARFGNFQAMRRVTCDRIYTKWMPRSNSPRVPQRYIGERTIAHCSAKARFERGDVSFDLWVEKSQNGWRIYQCRTAPS